MVSCLIGYYAVKLDDVYKGVVKAAQKLEGAFSLIIRLGDGSLIAVRDPNGYRPLCIGVSSTGMAISSESCGLDSCGFDYLRDVEPGEIVAN